MVRLHLEKNLYGFKRLIVDNQRVYIWPRYIRARDAAGKPLLIASGVILRAIRFTEWSGAVLGERSDQRGLWEADQLCLDLVGRGTFYGLLALLRGQLFQDADFAEV